MNSKRKKDEINRKSENIGFLERGRAKKKIVLCPQVPMIFLFYWLDLYLLKEFLRFETNFAFR